MSELGNAIEQGLQRDGLREQPAPRYRVYFAYDSDACLDAPNGGPIPESEDQYLENPVRRQQPDGSWADITYAEYCAYEGNPDRHVVLVAYLQRHCPCCDSWKTIDDLYNIDCMDDSPELRPIRVWDGGERRVYYDPTDPKLTGYLRTIVEEMIANVQN